MVEPDLSKMRVEIKWAEDMWQQIKHILFIKAETEIKEEKNTDGENK